VKRDLGHKGVPTETLNKAHKGFSVVGGIIIWGSVGLVCDPMRFIGIFPIVETTAFLSIWIWTLLAIAVGHPVVVPIIAVGLPLCVALAVGGRSWGYLHGCVHVVESM
jgi:hypothetical protein